MSMINVTNLHIFHYVTLKWKEEKKKKQEKSRNKKRRRQKDVLEMEREDSDGKYLSSSEESVRSTSHEHGLIEETHVNSSFLHG